MEYVRAKKIPSTMDVLGKDPSWKSVTHSIDKKRGAIAPLFLSQRCFEIGYKILWIFDPNAQTHKFFGNIHI
jgi:hypothetical protein